MREKHAHYMKGENRSLCRRKKGFLEEPIGKGDFNASAPEPLVQVVCGARADERPQGGARNGTQTNILISKKLFFILVKETIILK